MEDLPHCVVQDYVPLGAAAQKVRDAYFSAYIREISSSALLIFPDLIYTKTRHSLGPNFDQGGSKIDFENSNTK